VTERDTVILTLHRREAEALVQALDSYLPELEFELARIKRPRDRHGLVERDQMLIGLRERLGAALDDESRALPGR
jgi:hypothetical protein